VFRSARPARGATTRSYRLDLRAFQAFTDKPLRTITVRDLQDFAAALDRSDLAPASVARRLSAIKSLIGYARRMNYVPFDVGAPIRLPAIKNRLKERILTEEQVQHMLYIERRPRNAALLRLLYGGGLRLSEASALRWRSRASWSSFTEI
jgi:integrase/recombinase XerD